MNIIFMDALMEKFGFQLMILALCTGISFFDCFVEGEISKLPEYSSEFVLVKKSHDIELYERWYKMESGQLSREVKAVCTINSSLDSAISLVRDESKGTAWNKGTNSFRIIPQKENGWLCYIQYSLPWPMDNQDCVLQNKPYFLSKDYAIISFRSIEHDSFPEFHGVHRIPYVKGKWVFRQKGEDIRTEYYITTTPSTILPSRITDPIIRHNLISTIDRFRSLLEK